MSFGQNPVNVIIASGASTSSNVDLGAWRSSIFVHVSTMSTQAAITVQNSPDGGTTFYNCFVYSNSSTTQANPVNIASSVGTNGGMIQLPGGLRFVRFMASAVVSGGVTFKVVGND